LGAGVEHQFATLDDEPHRSYQRPTIGGEVTQHRSAGAFGKKLDDVG
jgi:hypothetical protein